MRRWVLILAALASVIAVTAPARADYALVQLQDGWCKVWWDSGATPWGVGWTKIAIGAPAPKGFAARVGVPILVLTAVRADERTILRRMAAPPPLAVTHYFRWAKV